LTKSRYGEYVRRRVMDGTASVPSVKERHMNAELWVELLVALVRLFAAGIAG